jgi:hypothetical protein
MIQAIVLAVAVSAGKYAYQAENQAPVVTTTECDKSKNVYTTKAPEPAYTNAAPAPAYAKDAPAPAYTKAAPKPAYTKDAPAPAYTKAAPKPKETAYYKSDDKAKESKPEETPAYKPIADVYGEQTTAAAEKPVPTSSYDDTKSGAVSNTVGFAALLAVAALF